MCEMIKVNDSKSRKIMVAKISANDLYDEKISINRIDMNTLKFWLFPDDIKILYYYWDFEIDEYKFYVEHESFLENPEGARPVSIRTKIKDYKKLIKLSENL